jgi:hypothetical protein
MYPTPVAGMEAVRHTTLRTDLSYAIRLDAWRLSF